MEEYGQSKKSNSQYQPLKIRINHRRRCAGIQTIFAYILAHKEDDKDDHTPPSVGKSGDDGTAKEDTNKGTLTLDAYILSKDRQILSMQAMLLVSCCTPLIPDISAPRMNSIR